MTTLRDYLRDLVATAIEAEKEANQENQTLTKQAIDDIVDETIEDIQTRLIG